jgi:hypothetical protein
VTADSELAGVEVYLAPRETRLAVREAHGVAHLADGEEGRRAAVEGGAEDLERRYDGGLRFQRVDATVYTVAWRVSGDGSLW